MNSSDDDNRLLVTVYKQFALTKRTSRSLKGGGVMIQLKNYCDLKKIHKNPLNAAAVIEISGNSLRFFLAVAHNKTILPQKTYIKGF